MTARLSHAAARPDRIAAVVLAAVLAGCATPASQQGMTATAAAGSASAPALKVKQQPYSIGVTAAGGSPTGATDSSNIGNADLKAAIEATIRDTKAFREIVQGPGGQYELVVNVIQLDKPSFGFSFTVNLEAGWTLTRAADKQVVLRRVVKSTHTVGAGEAFVGATRLRLAVEGAVRNNIAQGLTAIGEASL